MKDKFKDMDAKRAALGKELSQMEDAESSLTDALEKVQSWSVPLLMGRLFVCNLHRGIRRSNGDSQIVLTQQFLFAIRSIATCEHWSKNETSLPTKYAKGRRTWRQR